MPWAQLRQFGLPVLVSMVVACTTKPLPVSTTRLPGPEERSGETQPSPSTVTPPPPDVPATGATATQLVLPVSPIQATAPTNNVTSAAHHIDEYRRDAAKHIYQQLPERIYKGKLPPFLKAVVVVDIHIDPSGQVGAIDWVRVPKHAPEVKQDIEQAIRQSAPFPAPQYLKQVSFTETWLWHRSGRFQLDTLTEGQH
jgi:protein TonB